VKLFATDVDGVLTDGGIYVDEEGRRSRRFSVKDGPAFELARAAGLVTAIVSGKDTGDILSRARELRADLVRLGITDKLGEVRQMAELRGISLAEVCYVGDDLADLEVMQKAGYAITVPGAPEELKEAADYVTGREGGHGALREAVEHLLQRRDRSGKRTRASRGKAEV
jgi:YrbI family 3-deoxy-D-manno-octulosonate 8-phosphate phosphatase